MHYPVRHHQSYRRDGKGQYRPPRMPFGCVHVNPYFPTESVRIGLSETRCQTGTDIPAEIGNLNPIFDVGIHKKNEATEAPSSASGSLAATDTAAPTATNSICMNV